jgi:hypothetical protein
MFAPGAAGAVFRVTNRDYDYRYLQRQENSVETLMKGSVMTLGVFCGLHSYRDLCFLLFDNLPDIKGSKGERISFLPTV